MSLGGGLPMRLSALTVAFLVAGGIGCTSRDNPGSPAGTTSTGGDNGNSGMMGADAGMMGGGGDDGGGGGVDMGMAGGADGGGADMGPTVGGPGPWPVADLTIYGSAQGLGGGIVDANPDDAQNIWAANGE